MRLCFLQENFKISPKQYHYGAKQRIRDNKGKRMTAKFDEMAKKDRENREKNDDIPSPHGIGWIDYVKQSKHTDGWIGCVCTATICTALI